MADPIDPTMEDAVNDGAAAASKSQEQIDAERKEEEVVRETMKEYSIARKFDKTARSQYASDRRYAAGTSDPTWSVNTNLIGSFIDILVSFLYARNPDISVRKAPQADEEGTQQYDDFAKTMELVVSRLWKQSSIKKQIRKQVRSVLSVGPGWIKAIMVCDGPNIPQLMTDLNDARVQLADLQAAKTELEEPDDLSPDETSAKQAEVQELIEALETKIEATIRKFLAIDFVPAQDMQVSIDVPAIEDYLEANWCGNAIYRPKDDLLAMFPRLMQQEIDGAKTYYQRQSKDLQPITDRLALNDGSGGLSDSDAEQYTTDSANSGNVGDEQGIEFAKVIEIWDKRTMHVKTLIEGVKRWAKEPYEPDYPTLRFYPYFYLSFYEVDGSRHPQSLSWRLMKLQDEYARSRSSFRTTRERSIPATLFNKGMLSPNDAKTLEQATHKEFVGVEPTVSDTPLQNLFAEKPIGTIDMRLYDNTMILQDMEKISGVQEALQSSLSSQAKTATEAQIQQTGFASRTTSDRDTLEEMLTDLANYTAQIALRALTPQDAIKYAGTKAFWPAGMDINDLMSMVELEITAGSTGKPKEANDKQAWGVILPVIKEAIIEINQAIQNGNKPLADAISELVKEVMSLYGVDLDPDRFIPKVPANMPPPAPPPPPPAKVNINLAGQLPPAAIPAILEAEAPKPPMPPPGLPGLPSGGPAQAMPVSSSPAPMPTGGASPTVQ